MKLAALDLQKYIEKMSGASASDDQTIPGVRVLVGSSKATSGIRRLFKYSRNDPGKHLGG